MLRASANIERENSLDVSISEAEIASDVFALLEGFALQQVRRYFHHRFWEEESTEAEFADRAEPPIKLENVAAHSWHVADAALLLGMHFEWLNRERYLSLALLHDKLEMYTGDANPVGRDGTGSKTHAFDHHARLVKDEKERNTLLLYVSSLSEKAAAQQSQLFLEMIEGASNEARFVKAIDKLQALAFVHIKKRGQLLDAHVRFTLRYSEKCQEYFPQLGRHYRFLRSLFLEEIAKRRGRTSAQLKGDLFSQLDVPLRSTSKFCDAVRSVATST
jgi:5'-deoxynucleotidase YfbR-like HD superfamily hydrolase